ncbi:MAG TPA: hypothetical protein PKD15_05490 [Candidatus Saccharibacteria bacterium]|jgi:hypothetical protein|nr:hypothetical protein [Candidatus Saccharibacteria bacterium]
MSEQLQVYSRIPKRISAINLELMEGKINDYEAVKRLTDVLDNWKGFKTLFLGRLVRVDSRFIAATRGLGDQRGYIGELTVRYANLQPNEYTDESHSSLLVAVELLETPDAQDYSSLVAVSLPAGVRQPMFVPERAQFYSVD